VTLEEALILAKSQMLNPQQAHAEASPIRLNMRFDIKGASRNAAVMILICGTTLENAFIPVIKRSLGHRIHAGQIGFPGGKCELYDATPFDTAIRECREEIGITVRSAYVALSPVFIPVSGMYVMPYMALHTSEDIVFKTSVEVDQLYKLQLKSILNMHIEYASVNARNVPGFFIENEFIWGATAMILNEFKTIWKYAVSE
jgi:8-oxo-dGTP pyrophosphatase MutT (NUDIX family)